jgi:hypothetical protein
MFCLSVQYTFCCNLEMLIDICHITDFNDQKPSISQLRKRVYMKMLINTMLEQQCILPHSNIRFPGAGRCSSSDGSNQNQNDDIFAYMLWNLSTENVPRLKSVVQKVI